MPERAIFKLKRAGITLFNVKKAQKNQILFEVNKKDVGKVFAIYPKVCYNRNEYSAYTARPMGAVGAGQWFEKAKKRTAFLLGALLFCACTLYTDRLVFGIQFVGTDVYARESKAVLKEYGIQPFSAYKSGNEDLVCAKLLSLDGVEFCSVQKSGMYVRVEMRLYENTQTKLQSGELKSRHSGKVVAITALRGTALKKAGEEVRAGETLVANWFVVEGKEQIRVDAIARASIACAYEAEIEAQDKETAFAEAYLALGLQKDDRITSKQITQTEKGFLVKIEYTAIEKINF